MEKLWAILDLFRKGNMVANPQAWKNGGIGVAALVPCLLALARVSAAFGFELVVTEADAGAIAAGIVSIAGIVTTVVSSDKVGLPAKPAPAPAANPTGIGDGTA